MRVALIAGATGLIGKNLLSIALDETAYGLVKTVTRRPLNVQHAKHENIVADFENLQSVREKLTADDIFCCLGTTMKRAGSKEAFWKVDHDYPLVLGKITREMGAKQYLLVSALGASTDSTFYYNQVKGKVELAIEQIGFHAYHIFRPSLLLGPRNENRTGEDAAKLFYRVFNFAIPSKYKAIDGRKVAMAMRHFALQSSQGKHIHESASLQSF